MENIKYKNTEKFTPDVIKEILRVAKEHGLTAENLLNESKNEKSPLHDFFDWDDSIAGEKWRIQQARIIINEVKIIVEDKELYAFENVKVKSINEENPQREYKSIIDIMSKEEYRKQIIQTALDNIVYWKEKYSEYSELKPIFISIDKVKQKWQKKKQ